MTIVHKREKQQDFLNITKKWYFSRTVFKGIPEVVCYKCKREFLDDNSITRRKTCPSCKYRGYDK